MTASARATSVLALLLAASTAAACSAFLLRGGDDLVFGRNYDWMVDDALVFVNKRGLAKAAGPAPGQARWTSRFGSVTFNQYGRESPLGGMNERGLVIATLWLDGTVQRPPDATPTLGSLQWVQYQLDNCSTVAQVLATDRLVRITPGPGASVHYLVADASGAAATVEFLAGAQVAHTGATLSRPVLTNDPWAASADYLATLDGFGGTLAVPTDFGSLARFARACLYLRRYEPGGPVPARDYAFSMLASVSSGMYTRWSLVYDIPARRVSYRTQRNQALRSIDLARLDFSGRKPTLALDINDRAAGDVTGRFVTCSALANRALVFKVFRAIDFLKDIPDDQLDDIARYPWTFRYVGE